MVGPSYKFYNKKTPREYVFLNPATNFTNCEILQLPREREIHWKGDRIKGRDQK